MWQRVITKSLQRYWRLTRAVTLGAQVAVFDEHDSILLVRHGYRPGWHFPGGGVDRGETIHEAAVRELEEETGLRATAAPQLFGVYSNFSAFPGDHIALFLLRRFERVRMPPPTAEIAEQRFFPTADLPQDISAGTRARLIEIGAGSPPAACWNVPR
jgi:ADP-ribose pyrophosphatase YjhB (NUDIX family)